jgi:hypothetical protein
LLGGDHIREEKACGKRHDYQQTGRKCLKSVDFRHPDIIS